MVTGILDLGHPMKNLFALLMFLPSISSAWGGTGHEVICEIAFQELTDETRIEVQRLTDLDAEFDTFAESCIWAGRSRKRAPDHFINVPRDLAVITTDECPLAETCLFSAVKEDLERLSDKSRPDQERLNALKFLAHWVGDIHQPLNVSFLDDRGGNSIFAGGKCSGNFHSVWDGCIIERQLGNDAKSIATDLYAGVSVDERRAWLLDTRIEWANESYQVTLSPETGYCTMKKGTCWYWSIIKVLEEGQMPREFIVMQNYLSANQNTVELRLQQAGIRLGAILNAAMN